MEPFILKETSHFIIKEWTDRFNGLVAGFTTKNGGHSKNSFSTLNTGFHVGDQEQDVCLNRKVLSKSTGIPLSNWVGAEQTHDVHVKKVSVYDRGLGSNSYANALRDTDAFFTYDKNLLLTLCFADCVPLYFIAPKYEAIAIAHAGWKGTVGGIAKSVITVFKDENIPVSEIFAVIGPSICEKCYIVDDKVISYVENLVEDVEKKPYNRIKENLYHLDLKKLNKQILIKAGMIESNIQVTDLCTSCDSDYFFSHRRDKGKTGRMMSFIGWKEEQSRE
ncbi:peptidoglycan editing factor PgeF [Robertmurraya beringensis]|uniref:Purine nucleoside phosphorylase n=1 Tax=Robertmurraya beringensis TaxID=641660 RepID=A0ABV6KNC5_9BACI